MLHPVAIVQGNTDLGQTQARQCTSPSRLLYGGREYGAVIGVRVDAARDVAWLYENIRKSITCFLHYGSLQTPIIYIQAYAYLLVSCSFEVSLTDWLTYIRNVSYMPI